MSADDWCQMGKAVKVGHLVSFVMKLGNFAMSFFARLRPKEGIEHGVETATC